MAKKKAAGAARAAKPATAAKAKKQPEKKKQPPKSKSASSDSTTKSVPSKGQRPISNALIGETAGKIWQALAANNGQTLAALKKATDASDDHVVAAVGWLAREDKLAFESSGRTIKVTLR